MTCSLSVDPCFSILGIEARYRFKMTSEIIVRSMIARSPRAPPIIAPNGMLLGVESVSTEHAFMLENEVVLPQ